MEPTVKLAIVLPAGNSFCLRVLIALLNCVIDLEMVVVSKVQSLSFSLRLACSDVISSETDFKNAFDSSSFDR